MQELRKNHLKIFLIELYGIPHTYRKRIISTFMKTLQIKLLGTFINSKVVYFKKHLA